MLNELRQVLNNSIVSKFVTNRWFENDLKIDRNG